MSDKITVQGMNILAYIDYLMEECNMTEEDAEKQAVIDFGLEDAE